MKIQAYVVSDISQVRNEHVEIVKTDYPHLRDIWFFRCEQRGGNP